MTDEPDAEFAELVESSISQVEMPMLTVTVDVIDLLEYLDDDVEKMYDMLGKLRDLLR